METWTVLIGFCLHLNNFYQLQRNVIICFFPDDYNLPTIWVKPLDSSPDQQPQDLMTSFQSFQSHLPAVSSTSPPLPSSSSPYLLAKQEVLSCFPTGSPFHQCCLLSFFFFFYLCTIDHKKQGNIKSLNWTNRLTLMAEVSFSSRTTSSGISYCSNGFRVQVTWAKI